MEHLAPKLNREKVVEAAAQESGSSNKNGDFDKNGYSVLTATATDSSKKTGFRRIFRHPAAWAAVFAAVLVAGAAAYLVSSGFLSGTNNIVDFAMNKYLVAAANYPEVLAYPQKGEEYSTKIYQEIDEWERENSTRRDNSEDYPENYNDFVESTMKLMLTQNYSDSGDVTQDTDEESTQNYGGESTQSANEDTTQDASEDTTQDVSGESTQSISEDMTQNVNGEAIQDANEDTTQDVAGDTTQFLTENLTYSPLNIYLALALLADMTDGNTQAQILSTLGTNNQTQLQTGAAALWEGNYRNDGITTSILAGSLWLDEDITYSLSTIEEIAERYQVSVFQGPMGSAEYTNALISWINDQTGNLLEEQTGDIQMSENTVMTLVTTIYYKARWEELFNENNVTTDTFHGTVSDVECEFMNRTLDQEMYYAGDHFGAVFKSFDDGGGMWLILPDEDSSVGKLLEDDQLYELLDAESLYGNYAQPKWENSVTVELHLSMPKFDITCEWELADVLRALGITDVFEEDTADFSVLFADEDVESVYLSKAEHVVRVTVDEEGVEASAYTMLAADSTTSASEEYEEVDFILDRPFIYAIVSDTGTILFVGTVNQL